MDEIRGPNIQIVLHVKEGLGFGFLRTPFIVSGSLNGYMLETDPVVPCHAPVFDAELVWEADKRRFRSLRVQNVPIKVEVFTTNTQGRKDKIGYLLLSLLGAQPCPSNKITDIKYSWHKLLGIRSEGKCCHPQLMMSLSIEDRISTPTPRNELRMFHSNEIAYPSNKPVAVQQAPVKSMLMSLKEFLMESKRTVSSTDLQPQLVCDEGLIQIGSGRDLFVLSFVIGAVENLDVLLPENVSTSKDSLDCYVSYSVFTHTIMTDRVAVNASGTGSNAQFNQRTSLRVRSDLTSLCRYFTQCPHTVATIILGDTDVGLCSMDLRKLIPTDDLDQFINNFCNMHKALTINERCFILRCDDNSVRTDRRPYVDIEMSLKYIKHDVGQKPTNLTARSATQLNSDRNNDIVPERDVLDYKSGSCTNLEQDLGGVAYTNMAVGNTARYKTASGQAMLQTNEIADMIKKMCDSFTMTQERLLASREKPMMSDMQVQCGIEKEKKKSEEIERKAEKEDSGICIKAKNVNEPAKLEPPTKIEVCVNNEKDILIKNLSSMDRDSVMRRYVEELEDWKEKQQELFKHQLKRKEDYHLDILSKEWTKKRLELECKLTKGIEQCRCLAADLSRATDDFRLKGFRNTEREKKLLEAKKALESHYTAKYQELREASQNMEDDMNHKLKLKDMKIEELELKVQHLEKQIEVHKNNAKNFERDAETRYSGLTKDQTASLIQELRCLEEKLDSAVQSKAFFKEQWGRAVRELHLIKLHTRRQMLSQLKHDRREMGLDTIHDQEENCGKRTDVDLNKLKDDFYVDLLANTPALESHSIISSSGPDGIELYEDLKNMPKNPANEKLSELISQRDQLIQQDNPNEDLIKQLNHEIRNMLLNCGT